MNFFNMWFGFDFFEEIEVLLFIEDFDVEGEREVRVFIFWLNFLDVEFGVYNLFEDLKDGIVLL